MAKSGQEVVHEGWLTKSPPTKRIWRARWRRRWFSLSYSGELPGQFVLTYYSDRNCRKFKGVINLDQCEQVDLGLKLEERKLKFDHVFDIKTPTRTYYLAADSEDEMKSWVNSICKVCGLKSTSEEDDLHISENIARDLDVIYGEEEKDEKLVSNYNETPPISPVSTSPYIPISECITGKSPIIDPQDFKSLLQHNMKNSFFTSDNISSLQMHLNETYDLPQRNYLNYVNDMQDPRFYDCPRQLAPPPPPTINKNELNHEKDDNNKNNSALQSPTDSESVFTDEDWVHNTSTETKNQRPSDSSADVDVIVTEKFTKEKNLDTNIAPPRPPKSLIHVPPINNYLNLNFTNKLIEQEKPTNTDNQKIITDDMYDFPRSHQVETETGRNSLIRRHVYNNAAPVKVEGQIFRYDISPKPGTSSVQVFKYDLDENQDEPESPISQSSSTTAYSNLPSPLLSAETQLMPPPIVNRDLKPKRKLSDSVSLSSNPEPSSPLRIGAPSVDRKLKPPTPLQEAHMRKNFTNADEQDNARKIRAAPSPTPPTLLSCGDHGRSHESLLLNKNYNNVVDDDGYIYRRLPGKMQYLDLDLECNTSSSQDCNIAICTLSLKSTGANTVYKKVDFMKTQAFNLTRNNLEKERKEPVSFLKK